MQVRDRAESDAVVSLKSEMHVVGNVRWSSVTVELVVTVVVLILTTMVVVGRVA